MNFWNRLDAEQDRVAFVTTTGSIRYPELAQRADALAAQIRAQMGAGLTRPLVLLQIGNDVASIAAYLACLRSGWPVILTEPEAETTTERLVATYGPNFVLRCQGDEMIARKAGAAQIDLHPELAVLLSTSGTTGASKLVRLSRDNIAANAASIAEYLAIRPSDVALTTLPLHYSYGMSVLNSYLHAGGALALTSGSLIEAEVREFARAAGVTSLALVPAQFDLLESTAWLPDLRYVTQAGGRLDPELVQRFARTAEAEGWELFIMYGQTEASPRMSYVPSGDAVEWGHTIGRPVPGGAFRLIDVAGREIGGTGQAGELVYRGPNVMMGYAEGPAQLAAPQGPQELRTGDIAERMENGYFRITGRASRFIKLFGLRISLDEVEGQLRSGGFAVRVTGTDSLVTIFTTTPEQEAALLSVVERRFNISANNVQVVPVSAMPLMASGKIDYARLRSLAETAAAERVASAGDLVAVFRAALRRKEIDTSKSFAELGGDSLSFLDVQLHLSRTLGHVPQNWEDIPVQELVDMLSGGGESAHPDRENGMSRISADLIARILAICTILSLHSTTWKTGGGTFLLLMLVGYSLARFQSGLLVSGKVLQTLRVMLVPILSCYWVILALVFVLEGQIQWPWLLLLGNFQEEIHPKVLIPYWFVSAYAQCLVIFAAGFLLKGVRRYVAAQPLLSALALCVAFETVFLATPVAQLPVEMRMRHPLSCLVFLTIGWAMFHARQRSERVVVGLFAGLVWGAGWLDTSTGAYMFMLAGLLVIVLRLSIPMPDRAAQAVMWVGRMTMFIYLAHPFVISAIRHVIHGMDALAFALTLILSVVAAAGLKAAYDLVVRLLTGGGGGGSLRAGIRSSG